MPKTSKRSHHRSDERRAVDSDEQLSNQSIVSDESEPIVETKKRHGKKKSKKSKKHRSKKKHTPSDSDGDSSDSSDSSSDSSEEEVVQRKKQKKHKKSKRRNRSNERKPTENDVEILHEPQKVHYISSDEEKHHHAKMMKRGVGGGGDDRKRARDTSNDRGMDYKSKWDSPSEEFERKPKRESPIERQRFDDRYHGEQRNMDNMRSNNFRGERNERFDKNERNERFERFDRGRQSPRGAQRPERDNRNDFRRDRRDDANQPEWRNRERAPDVSDRYRKDEFANRRFRGDEGRFGRQDNEHKRSFSPKGNPNRGRFDDRRDNRQNAPRFQQFDNNRRDMRDGRGGGDRPQFDRRPDIKREFNDRDVDRSRNDRGRDRNEHERNRNDRDRRSPPRSTDRNERPRSPMRSNPFRRNKNPDEPSDFRHDGQKPDRNDRNERHPKNGSAKRQKFNNRESDNENYEWGKSTDVDKKENNEQPTEKEKPNFGLSGKLTEDTNKVNGVILKYSEPPEARRPKRRWRLYPFKNDQSLSTIYIHRQSCFLIGRDKKICEIAVDHPSCSKQHAALQYRLVNYSREDGTAGKRVRPYIIDLESANGTFVNNNKIEPRKYFELFEKDVVKFGFSSREYVLLHEDSHSDEDEAAYSDGDENDPIKTET